MYCLYKSNTLLLLSQEVELDANTKTFSIINARLSSSVIQLLLTHLEKEVEDTEWVLNRLKAETESSVKSSVGMYWWLVYVKIKCPVQ